MKQCNLYRSTVTYIYNKTFTVLRPYLTSIWLIIIDDFVISKLDICAYNFAVT